ncbi:LolA family protein [Fervidibacillus halotolerans]|uniref:Outer membrane lipoprotein carrier protein LolA n=1 Tax=Fervidibacillus halotolerans TaxID=2980027 RepID=A0A9E8LZS2_9BACI|nr:outer membrane lipoprotein carrier protein LolA [Fervidibacillus halotolerans]WAA12561.1 outer membrane lipoprotein carrier protein LolA [Fervidibacillus halotolerans]
MKKYWVYFFPFLIVVLMLAGCGAKTEEEVIKDLQKKAETLEGYKMQAKMKLTMGTDPQEYEVEIWHNRPDYYRVNMKNAKREQSQMILKNKEGVFVLTPALKKSFKFQSEWPNNSSQPYLYESLVKDVIEDKDAKMTETKEHYVFEAKTRYQYNKMMPIQEITFDKKSLAPVQVKIMDQDRNVMLAVEFSDTKFNTSFDEGSFDLNRNMTSTEIEMPVTTVNEEMDHSFTIKIPTAEIPGTTLVDEEEISTANGIRIVMTYDGEKSFTLMQEKVNVLETSSMTPTLIDGDPVDLGFTIGALTERSIIWTDGFVEYMIASNDLTKEEMVMLAKSMQGTISK